MLPRTFIFFMEIILQALNNIVKNFAQLSRRNITSTARLSSSNLDVVKDDIRYFMLEKKHKQEVFSLFMKHYVPREPLVSFITNIVACEPLVSFMANLFLIKDFLVS